MNPPTSNALAERLINAGCVSFKADEPFRLPSGWASPVYMDCRRLISFPDTRRQIVTGALAMLRDAGALDRLDGVVGAEASGIAFAAWIAEALDLPLQYVRKRAVGHAQVEGVLRAGDRVLLVDDLMAAGLSKAAFHQALTARGAVVEDAIVVFDYGTFDAAGTLLRSRGIRVHALCTWRDILAAARSRAQTDPGALDELEAFIADPAKWSAGHGGVQSSPW
ncbi:MAG: phosphoribosyltransferase family protein [Burkholderiaceae bacterium]